MNKLKEKIIYVEEALQTKLDEYVKSCFEGIWLPSHGLHHHRRVWSFAKDLLLAFNVHGAELSTPFINSLIIACYFHDVGMIHTIAPAHGEASAEIASNFINENSGIAFENQSDLIDAIIHHDNKEYFNVIADLTSPSVYMLLTVADDLDAFGALGLYRYIEIYQMRQVDYRVMGEAILTNLDKRFAFVERVLKVDVQLHQIHYSRYQKVKEFVEKFTIDDYKQLAQLIEMKEDISRHTFSGCLADFQTAIRDELKGFRM